MDRETKNIIKWQNLYSDSEIPECQKMDCEEKSRKTRSQSFSVTALIGSKECHKIPKWSLNSEMNLIDRDNLNCRSKEKSLTVVPCKSKSHSSQNLDQSKSRRFSKYLSNQRKSIASIGSDFLGEHSIESARSFLKLSSKIGINKNHTSNNIPEKEHSISHKKFSLDSFEDTLDLSDTYSSSSSSSVNKLRRRGSSSWFENRDFISDVNSINVEKYEFQKETDLNESRSIEERSKLIRSDERASLLLRRQETNYIKSDCTENDNFHKSSLSHFQPYDYVCKVVLLGDSGVGKTCLLVKFQDGVFLSGSYISTVGIDFRNKVISIDNSKVKLQIWDTAGQERFRSVAQAYYRDAHALLLLYDVTSWPSFENTREWLAEVHEYAQDDVVIMLIGNKCDVPVSERQIRREDGERLAREYNVAFMETSAKTGLNVDLAFIAVARNLKERKSKNILGTRFNVSEYIEEQEKIEHCVCRLT